MNDVVGNVDCSPEKYAGADPSQQSSISDIGGTGVQVNFVATGLLIVLLLLLYYVFVYDPRLDPFRDEDQPGLFIERPNPVDVLVLKKLRWLLSLLGVNFRWLNEGRKGSSQETAFNKSILMMSDIQIVTGTAIMISGYIGIPQGLSRYYWELVVLTAWFSTVTHIAALSHLRNYYVTHMRRCVWRIVLMSCLLLSLVFGMVVAAPSGSHANLAEPVICSFPGLMRDADPWDVTDVVFSAWLLGFGFISRVLKMHEGLLSRARAVRKRGRDWLVSFAERLQHPQNQSRREYMPFTARILVALWLVGRACLDIFASFLAEVFWLWVTAAWGLIKLIKLRVGGPEEDTAWGFGQIVAVILLLAPLISVLEYFTESGSKHAQPRTEYHNDGTATLAELPFYGCDDIELAEEKDQSGAAKYLDPDYFYQSPWMAIIIPITTLFNLAAVTHVFIHSSDRNAAVLSLQDSLSYLVSQLAEFLLLVLLAMGAGEGSMKLARHRWFLWPALLLFILFPCLDFYNDGQLNVYVRLWDLFDLPAVGTGVLATAYLLLALHYLYMYILH